jgi:hypothetical protein
VRQPKVSWRDESDPGFVTLRLQSGHGLVISRPTRVRAEVRKAFWTSPALVWIDVASHGEVDRGGMFYVLRLIPEQYARLRRP